MFLSKHENVYKCKHFTYHMMTREWKMREKWMSPHTLIQKTKLCNLCTHRRKKFFSGNKVDSYHITQLELTTAAASGTSARIHTHILFIVSKTLCFTGIYLWIWIYIICRYVYFLSHRLFFRHRESLVEFQHNHHLHHLPLHKKKSENCKKYLVMSIHIMLLLRMQLKQLGSTDIFEHIFF